MPLGARNKQKKQEKMQQLNRIFDGVIGKVVDIKGFGGEDRYALMAQPGCPELTEVFIQAKTLGMECNLCVNDEAEPSAGFGFVNIHGRVVAKRGVDARMQITRVTIS